MDLTGKVIAILPASSGVSARTGNAWMSQDYVIEMPGQYPRRMLFRVFGEDRIKMFNIHFHYKERNTKNSIELSCFAGKFFYVFRIQ